MAILAPEVQSRILVLHFSDKRSIKSIAREFGVDPKTVRRVVRRRQVRLGPVAGKRASILDPFKEEIGVILKRESRVTSTAVLNHLRSRGYTGGITILQEFIKSERVRFARPREAFLRLEFAPAEVAQVDWGEFGDVFGDGVKVHCFAMVMAYSRMIYVEFTRSEKFEEFIRAHENAFLYFGGVPRQCWYDYVASHIIILMCPRPLCGQFSSGSA